MAGESSTQVLQEILNVPGIKAIVVVGRDGFVIETAGALGALDLDTLGASVAMLLSGAESMGAEMKLSAFNTLTLEAANAMIMCTPVGDALLVILAPDYSGPTFLDSQLSYGLPRRNERGRR